MRTIPAVVSLCLLACSDVNVDENETEDTLPPSDGPYVEFDPNAGIVAFPTNLLLDPATGDVNLPEQCGESATQTALRSGVLNALDGFGTFKSALRVTFSEAVNADTLTDRIKLYRRTSEGQPIDPANAQEVPVTMIPGSTVRFSADCSDSQAIPAATIVPQIPLSPRDTYVAVALDGIETADGKAFLPSITWGLTRQATNPVTVEDGVVVFDTTPFDRTDEADQAALLGVDLLWKAHAQGLAFIDGEVDGRDKVLLAWEFTTQTIDSPLDADVAGSPAAELPASPLVGVTSVLDGSPIATFMEQRLGTGACSLLPCDAIGDVIGGGVQSPTYQLALANPLAGGDSVPGPWADPNSPTKVADSVVSALLFKPAAAAPAEGYPVVFFGHGLTLSKETLIVLASQLAQAGFVGVSIDWVNHGDRVVQTSDAVALGCDSSPTLRDQPQCFAPIFSSDLASTRDSFRQSALDGIALVNALKRCTAATCAGIEIDSSRMGYLGMSLGSLIGGLVVGMATDLKAAVLNVGGVGLIDLVEHTDRVALRCSVVDSLIAAGVIEGTASDLLARPPTGTCIGEEWKTDPAYLAFANVARWILDPADGANYMANIADRSVLVQEVVGDDLIPNFITGQMGGLLGLTPADAAVAASAIPTPSSDITGSPGGSVWLRYNSGNGNTYTHSSLINPGSDAAGQLATAQMQTDALTFLVQALAAAN